MSKFRVPVVKIESIRVHPNADRLELVDTKGFQTVVGKGQFKVGDLAIFVPPDSVVPELPAFSFVWQLDGGGKPRAVVPGEPIPEKYRRVTVKRLRKEYSEGLLMPITDFDSIWFSASFGQYRPEEGSDVAEALSITHYNPPEPEQIVHSVYHNFERGIRPKSLRGWWHWLLWKLGFGKNKATTGYGNEKAPPSFPPVYDVENFKHYAGAFEPGEEVVITEKVHGSNARFTSQKGKMYAGSRQFWKGEKTDCVWRAAIKNNPWIAEWCREHEGYTLYGEVVPTQGGYPYGATLDKPRVFIFDVLDPEGNWVEVFNNTGLEGEIREHWVPVLYRGPFDESILRAHAEGPSLIAPKQIREGAVVRPRKERLVHGLGRLQLKLVSNAFLEKDNK